MKSTKQNEFSRLKKRALHIWREKSLSTLMRRTADKMLVYSQYKYRHRLFRDRTFTLFDQQLPYFIHHYNATWRNERCIEIAAAAHFLKQWSDAEFLELGNVMSYYMTHQHYVVDKYERSPGVHNIDFSQFIPPKRFDGFISISTIEHIGWDEKPREAEKVRRCIDKIDSCVKSKEKVFVSFPLGYNEYLDDLVIRRELPFQSSASLVRVDDAQNWMEVELNQALQPEHRYGCRFQGANACFFGLGLKK